MAKPIIINVVAQCSNVGKTHVVSTLIPLFKQHNLSVATIKHDVHNFDIDHPNKDTYKHAQAGADSVLISSPYKVAQIQKVANEVSLDSLVARCSNYDVIIIEGYKNSNYPKLEVYRSGISTKLISDPSLLIGIVSDVEFKGQQTYRFDQLASLVNHLIQLNISNVT